jgi:ABC-2 type transport system permease protein
MKTIIEIAGKEIKRIQKRPLFLLGAVIAPLILVLLLPGIYSKQVMQKIPTAVMDKDQTHTSRLFIRLLNQHRYIRIEKEGMSLNDLKDDFYKNKIFIVLEIPPDFEKDLKSGKQPTLSVSSFGANLLIGNIAYKAFVETITTLNGLISAKYLAASRGESAYTFSNFPPILIDFHNLYNPTFNYLVFLPPAAIIALFQMVIILLASTLIAGDPEGVKASRKKGAGWWHILAGKSLPLSGIMISWGFILVGIIYTVFKIPVKSGEGWFILHWVFFVFISIGVGLFISLLFSEEMLATEAAVFLTAPAFAFSGYTYPLWELPALHQWFAMLMPSTHFLPLFTQVIIQGSSVKNQLPFISHIIVYSLVLIILISGAILVKQRKLSLNT